MGISLLVGFSSILDALRTWEPLGDTNAPDPLDLALNRKGGVRVGTGDPSRTHEGARAPVSRP